MRNAPAPRRRSAVVLIAAAVLSLLFVPVASANWSGDPAANNAVAEMSGGETIPLVASTTDGGTWITWFDPTPGSYTVRAQLLSPVGAERFPHNGILISDHPQNSALFGWDMIADSSGNC